MSLLNKVGSKCFRPITHMKNLDVVVGIVVRIKGGSRYISSIILSKIFRNTFKK